MAPRQRTIPEAFANAPWTIREEFRVFFGIREYIAAGLPMTRAAHDDIIEYVFTFMGSFDGRPILKSSLRTCFDDLVNRFNTFTKLRNYEGVIDMGGPEMVIIPYHIRPLAAADIPGCERYFSSSEDHYERMQKVFGGTEYDETVVIELSESLNSDPPVLDRRIPRGAIIYDVSSQSSYSNDALSIHENSVPGYSISDASSHIGPVDNWERAALLTRRRLARHGGNNIPDGSDNTTGPSPPSWN